MHPRRALALILTLVLLAFMAACGSDASASLDTTVVSPQTVQERLDEGAVLLDVRTPEEFTSGHLPGALNIDVGSERFAAMVEELDTSATYVVYCRSGNRSAQAMTEMAEMGFTDLVNAGGYEALVDAGVG